MRGTIPNTHLYTELSLENGFIPVDENMETEITGVYAVGDIRVKKYSSGIYGSGRWNNRSNSRSYVRRKRMKFLSKNGKGLLLCLGLAIPSCILGKMFPVIGGPVFAILIGMVLALVVKKERAI